MFCLFLFWIFVVFLAVLRLFCTTNATSNFHATKAVILHKPYNESPSLTWTLSWVARSRLDRVSKTRITAMSFFLLGSGSFLHSHTTRHIACLPLQPRVPNTVNYVQQEEKEIRGSKLVKAVKQVFLFQFCYQSFPCNSPLV